MYKIFFISIFLILFSGCVTKELPAYKTYNLEPKLDNSKTTYFDRSIKILEPKTLASINSKAISYKKDGFVSDSYVLSRWSDKPTKMIQQAIASFLSNKNSYKFISTSNVKLSTDYTVHSELFEFNQSFEKDGTYARFSIGVYLVNNKNGKISYKNFTYTQKTNSNNALGFVSSINQIFNKFLIDLNSFIEMSLSKKSISN